MTATAQQARPGPAPAETAGAATLATPVRQDRWLPRQGGRPRGWWAAASVALHGLALAAAVGLLALPRLDPPAPDQPVEMLWEQPPAMESAALPEAEPPAPPPVPPPPEAVPPPPRIMRPAPLLMVEEAPPAQPESTLLLPPPPPTPPPEAQLAETEPPPDPAKAQTAEAEPPPEPLPLPPPPVPTPPPLPRPQPARQPSPRPTESRQRPVDSAQAVSPQPSADGSARVVGPTSPPQADYRPPQPAFPEGSRQRGETGTVRVRLQVDTAGQVTRVEVLETSGFRDLDRATEEYYRRWRFRPALREGQPVTSEVSTAMTWRLNGLAASRPW